MSDTPSDHDASSADGDSFDVLLAAAVGPPDDHGLGPAPLAPGETIGGRFVVEHHAGEGGMGAVYRCRDGDTGSPVALKVVRSLDHRHAGRFKREASILALLSHPAIVRYVAHGHTDAGLPYLAMEWLDGEDLGQRLRRERLTARESIGLIRRCCEGLSVAHARGFVHRDLKPSNIFLPGGDVASAKLLDFGLARGDAPTQTLTRAGTVLGTAGYMAPEQATGSATLDRRADLFSLGCVLFECLTGEPAFAGEHGIEVLEKVLRGEAPRVCSLRPSVSPALDRLVSRMLEKSREARPESALEVARQLRQLEAEAGPSSGPSALADVRASRPLLATVIVGQRRSAIDAGDALALPASRCLDRFGVEPMHASPGLALLWLSADASCPWVDRASRALDCARWLQHRRPELSISLGSGVVEREGKSARGSAIDRALEATHTVSGLAVDTLTSTLLATSRTVLGWGQLARDGDEPSPATDEAEGASGLAACVGRDKELLLLEATLQECIADGVGRAVLITGDSGLGKSQLARALLQRVAAREAPRVLSMAGQFSQRALPLSHARRLLGSKSPSSDPELACSEAPLGRALLEQLAKDEHRALLLVVDDAQWVDSASMRLLATSLLALAGRPLLLLGLARVELDDELRAAWRSMRPEELRLRPLTERAAERLLRATLAGQALDVPLQRVAALAEGEPRLLVALGRALREHESELSEATIALTQERLMRIPPAALEVLCAASVFGQSCWAGGVEALQGRALQVRNELRRLEAQQLLVACPASRFAGEQEYAFAHPLLRAAAYHLLSALQRREAHALATSWLLTKCDPEDALLVAQREAMREADANMR